MSNSNYPGSGQPPQNGPYGPTSPQSAGGYGVPQYGAPQGGPGYGQPGQPQGQGYPQGQPTPSAPYGPSGQAPQGPGPYGPGPQGPQGFTGQPAPGGKSKLPLIIGAAVAGVVILALILGLALRPKKTTEAGGDSNPTSNTTAAATADSPSAAVKGYLEALAAANADGALAFAESDPASKTFLTSEVLKAAMTEAPLTGINVPDVDNSSTYATVSASYKLGDRTINDTYYVSKVGDKWRLKDVAADVDFSYLNKGDLKVILNGVELDADKVYLFPGVYKVTSDNERVTWGGKSLQVDSPNAYPSVTDLKPTLTSGAVSEIRKAAQTKLNQCRSAKKLAPAGCGFGVRAPKGVKIQPSSIKWSIESGADAMKKMKPSLEYDDPLSATAYTYVYLKGTAKGTNGSSYYGYDSISKTSIDLSGDTVKVSFSG